MDESSIHFLKINEIMHKHRNQRNYFPHNPPPKNIPLVKFKFRSTLDFYNYFLNWVYIWVTDNTSKKDFWFSPAYIGMNSVRGYIWDGSPEDIGAVTEIEIYESEIDSFFPNLSS